MLNGILRILRTGAPRADLLGAPSTVLAARQLGQEASDHLPLLVREVVGMTRSGVGHPEQSGSVVEQPTETGAAEGSVNTG